MQKHNFIGILDKRNNNYLGQNGHSYNIFSGLSDYIYKSKSLARAKEVLKMECDTEELNINNYQIVTVVLQVENYKI